MPIKILHLSDLHITGANWDQNQVIKSFLNDINIIKKNQGVPDIVIFTGDIVFSGKEEEYKLFKEKVYSALKLSLGLPDSRFIFTPGNHDVCRTLVDPITRKSFKTLTSREDVNEIYDFLKRDSAHLNGLKNFNNFASSLSYDETKTDNDLFSVHELSINNTTIGIAALNSAWSSWGGGDDYGNLVLGEKQLELSYEKIKDCDLKICAFHHPFDWFKEFDKRSTKYFINSHFDFFLTGHEHDSYPYIHSTNNKSCINLKAGCLYESRDYYNGYSLIELDKSRSKCSIHYRTYFEKRRSFAVGENVVEGGMITLELNQGKTELIPANNKINAIEKINEAFGKELNNALILSDNNDFSLKRSFIKPTLSSEPESREGLSKASNEIRDAENINLDDVIFNDSNYLLVGKKETGKTTLLHYILSESINGDSVAATRFPVFVDFISDLQKGKNLFKKAVKKYFQKFSSKDFNYETELKNGNVILLIDNYDLKFPKKSRELETFINDYPQNKIILTTNETILDTITEGKNKPTFIYKKTYIHSFKRAHTRDLVNRVCTNYDAIEKEQILNRVMTGLSSCLIPSTPFMITAALSVYRSEKNFKPINKASLIEKFIEILLDKHTLEDSRNDTDYRVKEDFLCHLVEHMVESEQYQIDANEFETLTLKYLKDIGSDEKALNLINYFIKKNIFTSFNGAIYFKLKAFFEYFCAKKMIYDSSFYKKIISNESYLYFQDEIEYYAGLTRDNSNLLEVMFNRLEQLYKNLGTDIDLNAFDDFTIGFSILDSIERKKLLSSMDQKKKDTEGRDRDLDKVHKSATDNDQIISKKESYEAALSKYLRALILYGNILKLSELIKDQEKKENLTKMFIAKVSSATLTLMLAGDKIYDDIVDKEQKSEEEYKEFLTYILRTIAPLGISMYISENFPSPNFLDLYKRSFNSNSTSTIEKFISLSLCANLDTNVFLEQVKTMIENSKFNSATIEILTFLLITKYSMAQIPEIYDEQVLDLVSELYIKRMRVKGSKSEVNQVKEKVKDQFKVQKFKLKEVRRNKAP